MTHISIIGSGAWATTIANCFAENGHEVTLFCHRQAYVDTINTQHENTLKLPGVPLSPRINATLNFDLLSQAEALVFACPSSHIQVLETCQHQIPPEIPILSLIKGVAPEPSEGLSLISTYIQKIFPSHDLSVLSGPNIAIDIAKGLPAASVVASQNESVAKFWQSALSTPTFRVYTSQDGVGVELGGLLKNVIAIAAGVLDGLALGENAKASLITRGLQEMNRLALSFGAKTETLMGLSGMGDLIATCTSDKSRNYRLGLGLAEGKTLENLQDDLMAEGVRTTKAVYQHAQKKGVQMPVTAEVYAVLFDGKTPQQAIQDLMTRRLTSES